MKVTRAIQQVLCQAKSDAFAQLHRHIFARCSLSDILRCPITDIYAASA